MSLKLKLFSLANAYASPQLIGSCESVEGGMYATLIPLLECIHIVDRPFQFSYIGSACMIKCKLEGLNKVSLDVFILPLADPNLESRKHMCVVDLDFCF